MAIQLGNTNAWTKSTRSQGNGACVEVASRTSSAVDVRDSKDPDGPTLAFSPDAWTAFVADIGHGTYDLD
ncbi:DUF397 domain-containing protein [Streptomyces sp. NPDC005722]